jgi:hypothetical protein
MVHRNGSVLSGKAVCDEERLRKFLVALPDNLKMQQVV